MEGMRNAFRDEGGQAVVEYILTAASIIGMVSILAIGFRSALVKFWEAISKDVTAACPGCPADPAVRIR
jgi:Flp pilus assembly pilin Flp